MQHAQQLAADLEILAGLAGSEPQLQSQYQRLLELLAQLRAQTLHVAVLGQFKRGKSSFLNALLGETLLPVSVIPLTAVPVLLLPGPLMARVHLQNQAEPLILAADSALALESQLQLYVSEAQNPHNLRQVSFVEVFHPSALLAQGLVLVDTPGIGSTFRHNTETTRQWLPHCDVGLLVISSEPPLTEAELVFMRELGPQLSELVIVFNKKDTLDPADLAQSLDFLTQVLQSEWGKVPLIFALSARLGLQARQSGDLALWQSSGLAQLEDYLVNTLARRKGGLVAASVQQKTLSMAESLNAWLSLWLKAQAEPLQALSEKMALLEQQIRFLEEAQQKISALLQVDLQRQLVELQARAEGIRTLAESVFWSRIQPLLSGPDPEPRIRELLRTDIPPYYDTQMQIQTQHVQTELEQLFLPYRQQLTQISQDFLRHTGELFGLDSLTVPEDLGFAIYQDPYWVFQDFVQQASPLRRWLERWLPLRRERLQQRLRQDLKHLLVRNTTNLAWSLQLSLKENFRQFDGELKRHWADTLQLSHETLASVFRQRQQTHEDTARQAQISQKQADADQLLAVIARLRP